MSDPNTCATCGAPPGHHCGGAYCEPPPDGDPREDLPLAYRHPTFIEAGTWAQAAHVRRYLARRGLMCHLSTLLPRPNVVVYAERDIVRSMLGSEGRRGLILRGGQA